MSQPQPDILSSFWSPVCAVGSHGPAGPNAQICVSVFGAGVVPDRPRLMMDLWKDNFTTGLVAAAGTCAITVLAGGQANLLEPLGLATGHDGTKLDGVDFELTADGDTYFPGGVALIQCDVIRSFDLGDASAFLLAVRERRRLSDAAPVSRYEMLALASESIRAQWAEKIGARIPIYRDQMLWRE